MPKPLGQRTRQELLALAKTLRIVGRTLLTKTQLVRAIGHRRAKRAPASTPYHYTPMYPKPRSSPATVHGGGHRARSASASPVEGHPLAGTRSVPKQGTPDRPRGTHPVDGPGGAAPEQGMADEATLPDHYGETRLVVQARDPHWLHAYWELAGKAERQAAGRPTVLRVYALTTSRLSSKTIRRWFDIGLTPAARDWFIEVGQPASWWCLEFGVAGPAGFLPLVRSNCVETPADRPSDEVEEGWPRFDDALAAPMAWQGSSLDAARDRSPGAPPRAR